MPSRMVLGLVIDNVDNTDLDIEISINRNSDLATLLPHLANADAPIGPDTATTPYGWMAVSTMLIILIFVCIWKFRRFLRQYFIDAIDLFLAQPRAEMTLEYRFTINNEIVSQVLMGTSADRGRSIEEDEFVEPQCLSPAQRVQSNEELDVIDVVYHDCRPE